MIADYCAGHRVRGGATELFGLAKRHIISLRAAYKIACVNGASKTANCDSVGCCAHRFLSLCKGPAPEIVIAGE